MVVDVCHYFDIDLLAVPLPHFGLCEQAVQMLLACGNNLTVLEALTQGLTAHASVPGISTELGAHAYS